MLGFFVEINAKRDLLNSVQIQLEGGEVMEIHITYEWIPPICQHCKSFGHLEHHCPTIEVWVPKAKEAGDTDNAGVLNEAKSFVFDSEIPAGISAQLKGSCLRFLSLKKLGLIVFQMPVQFMCQV